MAWTFTLADLDAALNDAQAQVDRFGAGLMTSEELGRAYLWLDQPEPARKAFAEGAAFFKSDLLPLDRRDNAEGWTEYGNLLRHAGDLEGAHDAYRHALTLLNRFDDWLGDELRFLLGEPLEDDEGYVAQIARGELTATRKQIVGDIRDQESLPSYTSPSLTLYDLLELTFPEPRPPHLEMLRGAGLLVD
jgi:tetratricopeptide (TPR) repeat protein